MSQPKRLYWDRIGVFLTVTATPDRVWKCPCGTFAMAPSQPTCDGCGRLTAPLYLVDGIATPLGPSAAPVALGLGRQVYTPTTACPRCGAGVHTMHSRAKNGVGDDYYRYTCKSHLCDFESRQLVPPFFPSDYAIDAEFEETYAPPAASDKAERANALIAGVGKEYIDSRLAKNGGDVFFRKNANHEAAVDSRLAKNDEEAAIRSGRLSDAVVRLLQAERIRHQTQVTGDENDREWPWSAWAMFCKALPCEGQERFHPELGEVYRLNRKFPGPSQKWRAFFEYGADGVPAVYLGSHISGHPVVRTDVPLLVGQLRLAPAGFRQTGSPPVMIYIEKVYENSVHLVNYRIGGIDGHLCSGRLRSDVEALPYLHGPERPQDCVIHCGQHWRAINTGMLMKVLTEGLGRVSLHGLTYPTLNNVSQDELRERYTLEYFCQKKGG